jgi:two-component system, OmpR family, sensor histidine kinase KdpD
MAGALDAPWSAIAVTTDETLSRDDQNRLTQNLSLARQLGAEAATVEATSLVEGLLSAARERGATQIVIGKSPRHGWRDLSSAHPPCGCFSAAATSTSWPWSQGFLPGASPKESKPQKRSPSELQILVNLAKAAAIAAGLALASYPLFGVLTAQDLAMLMLCGVIIGALFLSPVGTFALAIFTGLAWNYLFTEPRFSITIQSSSDITMFLALLIASLSMGYLSNRLRRRGLAVARQQMHTTRLLEINTILTGAADTDDAVGSCLRAVSSLFNLPCTIQLRDDSDHASSKRPIPPARLPLDAKERGVALWAFKKTTRRPRHRHLARGQSAAPAAARPVLRHGRAFRRPGKSPLSLADRDLLAAIAAQLGLGLERNHLLHAIHRAEFLERGDQLRRSLLDHVSHELRTPVSVHRFRARCHRKRHAIHAPSSPKCAGAQKRLRRVVDQLVESTRIESGAIQPKPEWCDLLEDSRTAPPSKRRMPSTGHPA